MADDNNMEVDENGKFYCLFNYSLKAIHDIYPWYFQFLPPSQMTCEPVDGKYEPQLEYWNVHSAHPIILDLKGSSMNWRLLTI